MRGSGAGWPVSSTHNSTIHPTLNPSTAFTNCYIQVPVGHTTSRLVASHPPQSPITQPSRNLPASATSRLIGHFATLQAHFDYTLQFPTNPFIRRLIRPFHDYPVQSQCYHPVPIRPVGRNLTTRSHPDSPVASRPPSPPLNSLVHFPTLQSKTRPGGHVPAGGPPPGPPLLGVYP